MILVSSCPTVPPFNTCRRYPYPCIAHLSKIAVASCVSVHGWTNRSGYLPSKPLAVVESELAGIGSRNQRVESNKAWETGGARLHRYYLCEYGAGVPCAWLQSSACGRARTNHGIFPLHVIAAVSLSVLGGARPSAILESVPSLGGTFVVSLMSCRIASKIT